MVRGSIIVRRVRVNGFRDTAIKLLVGFMTIMVLGHLLSSGNPRVAAAFFIGAVLFFAAHDFTFPFVVDVLRWSGQKLV